MGIQRRPYERSDPMTELFSRHPLRLATVLAMLLAVAGIRDTSDALGAPFHVVEIAVPEHATVSALSPTEGDVLPAGLLGISIGTSNEPDATQTGEAPLVVERAIVHVQTTDSAGSGFLVEGGRVVTNAHVVGDASTATVWFSNGARRESRIVAVDDTLDIAVLDVPRAPVSAPALALIDRGEYSAAGAPVWAWGYPFEADVVAAGFSRAPTVSAGIVSAHRQRGRVAYIQTDAAVNPGSSGGPLLDEAGRVIGVNTLVLTPGGEDAEGLNFALDVAKHRDALAALLERSTLD